MIDDDVEDDDYELSFNIILRYIIWIFILYVGDIIL